MLKLTRGALITAATVLLLGLTAGTASADETPMQLAQDAAAQYWGAQAPCVGGVTINYAPNLVPPGATSTGLWYATTWDLTTSTASVYQDCSVTLNSNYFQPANEAAQFSTFCGVMVHEYGHLFGHWDNPSDPPTSITYQVIGPENEGVAPCVQRYQAAAALVPAEAPAAPVPAPAKAAVSTPRPLATHAERSSHVERRRHRREFDAVAAAL